MLVEEARRCCFVLVGNIPVELRSADLRAFFSHLVERRAFACFHFRHRPEHLPVTSASTGPQTTDHMASERLTPLDEGDATAQESTVGQEISFPSESAETAGGGEGTDGRGESGESETSEAILRMPATAEAGMKTSASRCCVAAVRKEHEPELLRRYGRGRHWAKSDGTLLRRKVKLSRLQVSFEEADQTESITAAGDDRIKAGIPWSDLCTLPELNPPSVMPNGNVGTPTASFLDLIRQCKLPGRLIGKLGLEFPKWRSKRRYGAVGLDYGCGEVVRGGRGSEEEEEEVTEEKSTKESDCKQEDEAFIPSDDDHDAEEWERYEALHDDVDKQGRSKERLYEEEMEVVWEKGGSGLVFYTDASHWQNLEGDFDEQCSKEDDWDVDTALYYDPEGGDKAARDMRDMRHEQSIREGAQQAGVFAGFERYTKGVGSKVLRRSGWTEGSGVGRASDGRTEPVDTEGQHPHNKTGLGYRGEKLIRHMLQTNKRPRRATRDVIISTVYDRVEEEESTVLRSAPLRTIKYRQPGIQFVAGKPLSQPQQTTPSTQSPSS